MHYHTKSICLGQSCEFKRPSLQDSENCNTALRSLHFLEIGLCKLDFTGFPRESTENCGNFHACPRSARLGPRVAKCQPQARAVALFRNRTVHCEFWFHRHFDSDFSFLLSRGTKKIKLCPEVFAACGQCSWTGDVLPACPARIPGEFAKEIERFQQNFRHSKIPLEKNSPAKVFRSEQSRNSSQVSPSKVWKKAWATRFIRIATNNIYYTMHNFRRTSRP